VHAVSYGYHHPVGNPGGAIVSSRLRIREATGADTDVFEAAMPTGADMYARHLADARRGETAYLVALLGGEPAGTCVLVWGGCFDTAVRGALPGVPELRHLRVREDRRGRGVGTALIAAAEDMARARGATRTAIGVEIGQRAANLYRRLGYRDIGLRWTATYRWPDVFGEEISEDNVELVKELYGP
jgi:GNAT superfamily N-acetyltransferase